MREHGVKIDTRRPFLLTGWSVIDLVVFLAYLTDLVGLFASGSLLRISWGFRPLRALSLINQIQVVMICMMDAVPSLLNVLLLGCCVFFVFGIMGLNVFMVGLILAFCHSLNVLPGYFLHLHRF